MKDFTIPVAELSDKIRPLTGPEELADFQMREKDAEEALAATGKESPLDALMMSVEASSDVWIVQEGPDKPVAAVFGVAPCPENERLGIVWLLGTPAADKLNPIEFAKVSRKVVDCLAKPFDMIFNFVMADYSRSIRWLRFLGFTFSKADYYLKDIKKPFKMFWRYT